MDEAKKRITGTPVILFFALSAKKGYPVNPDSLRFQLDWELSLGILGIFNGLEFINGIAYELGSILSSVFNLSLIHI